MAEKIHAASKPTGNPPFPATKARLYNHSRPVYRPQPNRYRRSFCCSLCFYIMFIIMILILLAAAAGGALYILYRPHRPHRPTFSVDSLTVSKLVQTSNKFKFNLTVTARNPNDKIVFYYDPVSVTFNSENVGIGDGTIPAFTTEEKNATVLKTIVTVTKQSVDQIENSDLKSDSKSKKRLLLKIELDTKVKVIIGLLKMKKVPIRVTCDGIEAAVPAGKKVTTAMKSDAECKVDLRFKIWKWTI